MDALDRAARDLEELRIRSEDMIKVQRLSSFGFVVWGTATLLAVAFTYLLIKVGLGSYTRVAWALSMYGALAISVFYLRSVHFGLSPLSTRILNHLWLSVTASAFVLGFVFGAPIHLNDGWTLYFVIVQMLIGIAVFITGGIYLLPAIRNVGILQWLGAAVIAAAIPPTWVALEFGIVVGGGLLTAAAITRMSSSIRSAPVEDEAVA